jgi:drug/metabolite transporter (DMT)-like permease
MIVPQHQAQRPLIGIFLVLAAVFIFACMDTTGKYLAQFYPVPMFLAARYFVNLILVVVIFAPKNGWAVVAIQRKGLVLLRAFALAISSLFAGLALKSMPVAETVAIIYVAPFGVILLSGPILKEHVRLSAWIATFIGFVGLLLIVRPGSGLSPAGVGFALLTIGGTIIYHLFSRLLAKTETTMALLFHTALIGTVVFGAMLPWNVPHAWPSGFNLVLIFALGGFSTLGHFLFTVAYREAPAALLTPINYMHLAWAAFLGWIVFSHVPDHLSMLGIALVAIAGAGNAVWSHFRKSDIAVVEPEEV